VQRELIKRLADTCAAWLDGDWQELPPLAESTEEEAALYTSLRQLRTRLVSCAKNGQRRNKTVQELENDLRDAQLLSEATKVLTSTLELEPLLKATTDKIAEMSELTDGAAIFLYDPARNVLEMVASFGYPDYGRQARLAPGEGAPGLVFLLRQPMLAMGEDEVAQLYASVRGEEKRYVDLFRQSHPLPSQSVICVPFVARGKAIGSLQLEHWRDTRTYTERDLSLVVRPADLIAISVDNAMLWRELGKKEERLHHMVGQLINAQEAERKRIARELHDDAGQALTTLAVGLSTLSSSVPGDLPEIRSQIAGLQDEVKGLMGRMRDLTLAIRPSILDDLGLVAALKWYASRFGGSDSPQVLFSYDDDTRALDSLMATMLFRVAQEALNNALRHSQATQVRMALRTVGRTVVLVVEDNGIGFCVDEVLRDPAASLGLQGMSERLGLFNGSLHIHSFPGRGTVVRACVPLSQDNG